MRKPVAVRSVEVAAVAGGVDRHGAAVAERAVLAGEAEAGVGRFDGEFGRHRHIDGDRATVRQRRQHELLLDAAFPQHVALGEAAAGEGDDAFGQHRQHRVGGEHLFADLDRGAGQVGREVPRCGSAEARHELAAVGGERRLPRRAGSPQPRRIGGVGGDRVEVDGGSGR
jgi:hypothetical protein